MAAEHLGDMTRAELRAFVEAIVDERMRSTRLRPRRQVSDRPIAEVLEEMRRLRFTPKPGTPSVVEMLREDRDR